MGVPLVKIDAFVLPTASRYWNAFFSFQNQKQKVIECWRPRKSRGTRWKLQRDWSEIPAKNSCSHPQETTNAHAHFGAITNEREWGMGMISTDSSAYMPMGTPKMAGSEGWPWYRQIQVFICFLGHQKWPGVRDGRDISRFKCLHAFLGHQKWPGVRDGHDISRFKCLHAFWDTKNGQDRGMLMISADSSVYMTLGTTKMGGKEGCVWYQQIQVFTCLWGHQKWAGQRDAHDISRFRWLHAKICV